MIELAQLSRLRFFQGMPAHALVRISEAAAQVRLPAGHLLLQQYDRADTAYFLVDGSVQILIRVGSEDLLVGVLSDAGQLLGWSAFRPPHRYTATIRCQQATTVVKVGEAVFEELFARDAALAAMTLHRVAVSMANRFEGARTMLQVPPRRGPVGSPR